MLVKVIEKVTGGRPGKYQVRRGIKLTAQNRAEQELLDEVLRHGIEVDTADKHEIDLRLCK